jgi:serine/threonine protein kinase
MSGGGLLAGKFRVIRQLGQGGMGAVYEVENVYLGQRVAMKLLLDEMVNNQAIVERFLREARASALLRGEHVCKVFDVGTIENGAPYIVMEMLQGRDLASLLAQQGPLPPHVVAEYVLQACLGIAEAHAAKIVHRDLKPANLFLAQKPDGSSIVKVLDFGIAKAPSEQSFNLTQTSAVMGSPGYMSPEQLRSSRNVDARSDIWSIGTILFELSTGRPPFLAETITELAVKVSMDPTPVAQNVPPELARAIYRCLEKNPDQRFQNVADLATAIAPVAGPRGVETAAAIARILGPTRATSVAGTPATSTPTTLGGATGQSIPPASSSRRWPLIAGVLLAAGAAVAIVVVARGGGNDDGATQNATTPAITIDAAAPAVPDAGVAIAIDAAIQPAAIDAAIIVPPIDAAIIAPPIDAAVEPSAPDAGVRTTKPKPKPKPKGDSYENSRY